MIFETIRALLAEQLGYEESVIRLCSSLVEDLQVEKADLEEVMLLLEEEFELSWTEEDLKKLDTVADIVSFAENQV